MRNEMQRVFDFIGLDAAKAVEALDQAGYEVLVFHATGTGGRTMESLMSPVVMIPT